MYPCGCPAMSSSSAEPRQNSQISLNLFPVCYLTCNAYCHWWLTPIPDFSHPGCIWILLTPCNACLRCILLSVSLTYLQLTLTFNWRTVFFSPFKHCQLLLFPTYVCWIDNFNNHFPSLWDYCLKSFYWVSFPHHTEHYVFHLLALAYQYFMVVFLLESPADIQHLPVKVQMKCQWCSPPLGDHLHQQF